ncbi:dipeptidase [Alicyclobacillus ferrooxydans]|uniref:Peptidase M19 n=1 Tax=Alicyclobacillus ferrooxydans TaxID=471514 RepID=A0A0P9CZF4_9BACL|nr:membrane dipeptidase [Alicyclobacillus ferrooxydans]KPV45098.1 hypothetical protein AN477_03655 [Alicyclobacillus ferrooxydans]
MDRPDLTQIVMDLHSDIPLDIVVRRQHGERQVFRNRHYTRLWTSGTRVMVAALWTEPEYRDTSGIRLMQQLTSLLADVRECSDVVQLVTNRDELESALASRKVALCLAVEGMTFVETWPLSDLSPCSQPGGLSEDGLLREKYDQSMALLEAVGSRDAILVWGDANALATGPDPLSGKMQENKGLTSFGRFVVKDLESRGMVVDISHLDDESADGVLESTSGCVIASHSNARALCDVPRNLPDRHIRAIGQRGGIVGINAYAGFLTGNEAAVDNFVDHIVHVANLIGTNGVGFGFDFLDYLDESPSHLVTQGLEGVHDVPRLLERMQQRGFTDVEIDQIAYQNALRIMF